MKKMKSFLVILCGVVGAALASAAADVPPTALQLIKAGNQYVGDQSRDQVLGVYSDMSLAGLTPTLWYVDYYDPDAKFKIVEVKFGADLKLDVHRPWKLFGGKGSLTNVFDLKKLKVDSDKAMGIATSQQLLQPITLKATQLWLGRCDEGVAWKVRIWAAKLSQPDVTVEIGDVYLSPEDGRILRADLHVENAR
jgi:hypothetical protein